MIGATLAFIGGLDAARFEGSGQHEVVLRPGTPKERRSGGHAYLLAYGLPQFFFHVTTAYDLLRHNGVEIGKKDCMARTDAPSTKGRELASDSTQKVFLADRAPADFRGRLIVCALFDV